MAALPPRLGEGAQEDEGGARGGRVLMAGLGEAGGGRRCVDRTTTTTSTVLFAVLIPPRGIMRN